MSVLLVKQLVNGMSSTYLKNPWIDVIVDITDQIHTSFGEDIPGKHDGRKNQIFD